MRDDRACQSCITAVQAVQCRWATSTAAATATGMATAAAPPPPAATATSTATATKCNKEGGKRRWGVGLAPPCTDTPNAAVRLVPAAHVNVAKTSTRSDPGACGISAASAAPAWCTGRSIFSEWPSSRFCLLRRTHAQWRPSVCGEVNETNEKHTHTQNMEPPLTPTGFGARGWDYDGAGDVRAGQPQHLQLGDKGLEQLVGRRKREVAREGLRGRGAPADPAQQDPPPVLGHLVGCTLGPEPRAQSSMVVGAWPAHRQRIVSA